MFLKCFEADREIKKRTTVFSVLHLSSLTVSTKNYPDKAGCITSYLETTPYFKHKKTYAVNENFWHENFWQEN